MLKSLISSIDLSPKNADFLEEKSIIIANNGGPQSINSAALAISFSTELYEMLSEEKISEIKRFVTKQTSLFTINNLKNDDAETNLPESLSPVTELESSFKVLKLASRCQIILALVDQVAFAYDIDNYGKITRLVANFKGGGLNKIKNEVASNVDKSSYSGIALSAHTEAPYHTATKIKEAHSPAPSSLILTALWNPLSEPTNVIPIEPILEKLTFEEVLSLTTPSFDFTRSETFTDGQGSGGIKVSILEVDAQGNYGMKYNSYRFTANAESSDFVKRTFIKFEKIVAESIPIQIPLDSTKTLIINNTRALHCRDIIKDNRRALVRLFGYWNNIEYIAIQKNPLLVKG